MDASGAGSLPSCSAEACRNPGRLPPSPLGGVSHPDGGDSDSAPRLLPVTGDGIIWSVTEKVLSLSTLKE